MRLKINEIPVKYIECASCHFEKSCLLPETALYERFNWRCSRCNQAWSGIIQADGIIQAELDTEKSTDKDYILIEKSKGLIPWVLLVQKQTDQSDGHPDFNQPTTLYLFSVEYDKVNNPQGFPQYRAISTN